MTEKSIRVRMELIASQYQAQMAQAGAATSSFGQRLLDVSRNSYFAFTSIGFFLTAAGTGMVLALKSMAEAAAEFEGNLVRMITLAGQTEEATASMGQSILGMSDLGKGPLELSDSLYFILSSGQEGAAAMQILESSAKASAIGMGETKDVADLLTSVLNAYGAENISASRATDILTASVIEGKAEASDFVPVLGQLLGMAASLGVPFEDLAGTLSMLSRVGVPATRAATMISSTFSSLLTTSPKVTEALESVGLSTEQLRVTLAEHGILGVLRQLDAAFASNVEGLRTVFPNIRAFRLAMNLLAQDAAITDEVMRNIADSTGVTAESFERWSQTTEAAAARFGSSMEVASVAFGSLLLPAITAVLNVGVGFLEMIGGLPGPIKAVTVGVMAVAAAFLLFSGALFMTLPRVAQVKTAMADLGLTGGIMTGSLQLAGRALAGPFALSVIAATGVIMAFARAKQEARAEVDEFRTSIEADGGALDDHTRKTLAAKLVSSDLGDALRDQGISISEATTALLGGQEAFDAFLDSVDIDVLFDASGGMQFLDQALTNLRNNIFQGKEDFDEIANATGGAGDAAGGAVDPFGDLTSGTWELEDALEETASAADLLKEAFEGLSGDSIEVEKTVIGWRDALRTLREGIKDGEPILSGFTEEADTNRKNFIAAAQAAIEHGAAVANSTGSVARGARVVRGHIRELGNQAVAAGVSREEVNKYIRQLDLTPGEIRTIIKAAMEEAVADVARWKQLLGTIPDNIITTLQVREMNQPTYPKKPHGGGIIGSSMASGTGGIRSDEMMVIAQRGERVVTGNQWRNLQAMLSARPASGGVAVLGGSGDRMIRLEGPVTLEVGGDSFDGYIRGIAREEEAESQKFTRRMGRMNRG